MSMTLCHQDESSGTTIYDDGTKVYWTEGYSSAVIMHPNGTKEVVPPHENNAQSTHPVMSSPEIRDMATDDARNMTAEEEAEWENMMDWAQTQ